MNQITDAGTQVIPRYFQGRIVGITAVAKAKFNDIEFSLEQDWDIPEERQVFAESFGPQQMSEELSILNKETGLQYRLLEQIWAYKQENGIT